MAAHSNPQVPAPSLSQEGGVDALRQRLGVEEETLRKAGVVRLGNDLTAFPHQQRQYQEEMRRLAQGGNNATGREELRALMLRMGAVRRFQR